MDDDWSSDRRITYVEPERSIEAYGRLKIANLQQDHAELQFHGLQYRGHS